MKLSELKLNPKNPRFIKDDKFEKLKNNIKKYPKFLSYRPIVYDDTNGNTILAGNMRYRALKDLGFKEVPDEYVRAASDLSDEEKIAFGIIDNVSFGEFDYDVLANDFDIGDLGDWGVDVDFLGDSIVDIKEKEVDENIETDNECPKCGYRY